MHFGPSEFFRILVTFFLAVFILSFGLVAYKVNTMNSYENTVAEDIAKNGGVTPKVINKDNPYWEKTPAQRKEENKLYKDGKGPNPKSDLSDVSYRGMFYVTPGEHQTKTVTRLGKKHTVVLDYSQPQNYGQQVQYVIHGTVPILPFFDFKAKYGNVHVSNPGEVPSHLDQNNLNDSTQNY